MSLFTVADKFDLDRRVVVAFASLAVVSCAFVAGSVGGFCFLLLFPRVSASRQGGAVSLFPSASWEFLVYVYVVGGAGIVARIGPAVAGDHPIRWSALLRRALATWLVFCAAIGKDLPAQDAPSPGLLCPDCQQPLNREAGCFVCQACGYSKCG